MRKHVLGAALLAVGAAGLGAMGGEAAEAQGLRERLRQRLAERAAAAESAAPERRPALTIAYGLDPAQKLDFWAAADGADQSAGDAADELAGDPAKGNAERGTTASPGARAKAVAAGAKSPAANGGARTETASAESRAGAAGAARTESAGARDGAARGSGAAFRAGPGGTLRPLIVFVHGGGWQRGSKDNATGRWKSAHYPGQGYAFASIDYRLVPKHTVEEQAEDVALAVRALIDRAARLGIDRRRIVLMGHSAGAHLVALVGTDPRYLAKAGLSLSDIAGVVPVDGAAYDVPAQMRGAPGVMQQTYRQAFGSDPARQRALSPSLQAGAPNAPAFLLLHVQRPDGIAQAKELETALRTAGTRAERRDFPGTGLAGHMEINRRLGDPAYAATGVVDAWLKQLFAR